MAAYLAIEKVQLPARLIIKSHRGYTYLIEFSAHRMSSSSGVATWRGKQIPTKRENNHNHSPCAIIFA